MRSVAPLTLAGQLILAGSACSFTTDAAPATGFAVFPSAGDAKGVVLYLTDAQPNRALLDQLQRLTYTVAVVNIDDPERPSSDPSTCRIFRPDFQSIRAALRARHPDLPERPPILLGSGSTAPYVLQALAGASAGQFHAGISLDFCPPAPRPGCPDQAAPSHLPVNWYLFQSAPACDPGRAAQFIGRIDDAKLVDLGTAAGQPPSVPEELTALLQWLDPRIPDQATPTGEITGVPLTEVRARHQPSPLLAVLLSGDGGWAAIDRGIAAELAKQGVDTVGWDSLSYFWSAKTPEQAAHDLERVVVHYSQVWNKTRVMLVGYSFGADVLPFIVSRLSPEVRGRVKLAAFLGLGRNGSFEFHLSDWLGGDSAGQWPTQPEIRKLADIRRLCVYGADETDSGCPGLENAGVRVVKVSGDHHFDEAYGLLASQLLQALP